MAISPPSGTLRSLGGRSSAWLERQVVALKAGGSSPLAHPNERPGRRVRPGLSSFERSQSFVILSSFRSRVPYSSRVAPLAQRQSNGLLIRRFWVRIPGGALFVLCGVGRRIGRHRWKSSNRSDAPVSIGARNARSVGTWVAIFSVHWGRENLTKLRDLQTPNPARPR